MVWPLSFKVQTVLEAYMSGYTIDEARRIAINCASNYKSSLENKQFIIIYRDRDSNEIKHIEVVFLARNYQHLTGLNIIDTNGIILDHHSEFFYKKCVEKKLSCNEIMMRSDGTTQLKLEALPAITKFTSITKIVGDSNNNQPYLYVVCAQQSKSLDFTDFFACT